LFSFTPLTTFQQSSFTSLTTTFQLSSSHHLSYACMLDCCQTKHKLEAIMWLFHPKWPPPFPQGKKFFAEAVQITIRQFFPGTKFGQLSFSLNIEY
jgi:hypothetical protein